MTGRPMPETLETNAAKLDGLSKSIDTRFDTVDGQFAETWAQLGVKIEAVDTKITQVYDELIAMRGDSKPAQTR